MLIQNIHFILWTMRHQNWVWTFLIWDCIFPLCANLLKQIWHWNGFSLVWIRLCVFIFAYCENLLEQIEHSNGFSLVWTRLCVTIFVLILLEYEQMSHLKSFIPTRFSFLRFGIALLTVTWRFSFLHFGMASVVIKFIPQFSKLEQLSKHKKQLFITTTKCSHLENINIIQTLLTQHE